MKTQRVLLGAVLVGVLVFATGSRAIAQDTFSQDPLFRMLYDLALPGGSYGPYAGPSYDPYGPDPRGYYEPSRSSYDPYRYQERLERLDHKYAKAMSRLDRQEREARERAYRKYNGNVSHRGFRSQMAKIDRKYAHKRWKVERNTADEHRKIGGRRD